MKKKNFLTLTLIYSLLISSSSVFSQTQPSSETATSSENAKDKIEHAPSAPEDPDKLENLSDIQGAKDEAARIEAEIKGQGEKREGEIFEREDTHLIEVFKSCENVTGLPFDNEDPFYEFISEVEEDLLYENELKGKLRHQNNNPETAENDVKNPYCIDKDEKEEIDFLSEELGFGLEFDDETSSYKTGNFSHLGLRKFNEFLGNAFSSESEETAENAINDNDNEDDNDNDIKNLIKNSEDSNDTEVDVGKRLDEDHRKKISKILFKMFAKKDSNIDANSVIAELNNCLKDKESCEDEGATSSENENEEEEEDEESGEPKEDEVSDKGSSFDDIKNKDDLLKQLSENEDLGEVFKDVIRLISRAELINLNQNNKKGYVCNDNEFKTDTHKTAPYVVYGEEDVLVVPPEYEEGGENNKPSVAVINNLRLGGDTPLGNLDGASLRIIHKGGKDHGKATVKVKVGDKWHEVDNWNVVIAGHPDAIPRGKGTFAFKNGKTYACDEKSSNCKPYPGPLNLAAAGIKFMLPDLSKGVGIDGWPIKDKKITKESIKEQLADYEKDPKLTKRLESRNLARRNARLPELNMKEFLERQVLLSNNHGFTNVKDVNLNQYKEKGDHNTKPEVAGSGKTDDDRDDRAIKSDITDARDKGDDPNGNEYKSFIELVEERGLQIESDEGPLQDEQLIIIKDYFKDLQGKIFAAKEPEQRKNLENRKKKDLEQFKEKYPKTVRTYLYDEKLEEFKLSIENINGNYNDTPTFMRHVRRLEKDIKEVFDDENNPQGEEIALRRRIYSEGIKELFKNFDGSFNGTNEELYNTDFGISHDMKEEWKKRTTIRQSIR